MSELCIISATFMSELYAMQATFMSEITYTLMKPWPFPPNLENWAAEHVDDGVAESGADLVVQILLGLVAELADLVERLKG